MGFGKGGDYNEDLVDIGGDRFQLAVGVGAQQLAVSRLSRHHDPGAVAGAPGDLVPGYQAVQVGAQMAALAVAAAVLHLDLGAKVGDHQAALFRPQLTRGESLVCLFLTAPGALAALLLYLADAPALLPSQFAFAHAGIIGPWRGAVEAICYTARSL